MRHAPQRAFRGISFSPVPYPAFLDATVSIVAIADAAIKDHLPYSCLSPNTNLKSEIQRTTLGE
jgi:hypothetical protein